MVPRTLKCRMIQRILNFLFGLAVPILISSSIVSAANVTATWNVASGNWGVSGNWSNSPVTANFPNNGNGGFTYDAVLNNGGTVTLDQDITILKFLLSGGTLAGTRSLTLNDVLT